MGKRFNRGSLTILIGVILSGLLVGVIVLATTVGIIAANGNPLPTYTTKDITKELGTTENPYTILEIVPDVESATVGYLINGQEPNNLLSIGATDKSVAGSAAELYFHAFASENSPTSTMGDYIDAYCFKADEDEIGVVPASGFNDKMDTYHDEGTPGTDMAYSQYGYYTKVAPGTGKYNLQNGAFIYAPGGQYTWTCIGEFRYIGLFQGTCSRVMDRTSESGALEERSYSYNNSTGVGNIGEKAYKYTYSDMGDFEFVPNGNYNNENYYAENTSLAEITAGAVGDRFYMTRTEDVYEQYEASNITNNDLLIKNIAGDEATSATYKTQVVTVTPAQLRVNDANATEANKARSLIDTADMIIVHDSSIGYDIDEALRGESDVAPHFSNSTDSSGDLDINTANRIIERGASANPAAIVFDENAIEIANSYIGGEANKNCVYLKLIYDVYNNLGAKLAYNWLNNYKPSSSTPYSYQDKLNAAASDTAHYRDFTYNEADALGKSQFVYNFRGDNDSWLTNGFADDNKIVKSTLNESAFANVDAGNSMSVAKMLSAVTKESQGYNQPRHLRILELQPNEKFIYDNTNVTTKNAWIKYYLELFPWFIGTSKNIGDDITVTTMSTYEFIGKNDDVNENYDMIIVGNKQQDETNGGGARPGYNDGSSPSMAYKAVGDFITTYGGSTSDDTNPNIDVDSNNYKWNYALFQNNIWSTSRNAYSPNDGKWYVYKKSFRKQFVFDFFDQEGDTIVDSLSKWWYQNNNLDYYVYATKHGSDANMVGLRYSGNDLTKKKYDEILDFANQGPVVVSDELYYSVTGATDIVSEYVVDKSSFVYQLANKNLDTSAVNRYSNSVNVNSRLNQVKANLTQFNCSATFTNTMTGEAGLPTEYDAEETVNYNTQKDDSGNNILRYHFTVNGSDKSSYGVNLYTDSNGNGVFEGCINNENERRVNGDSSNIESEKASNLTIFDETARGFVYDGVLYSGHTYLVTKIVPVTDVGLIPWKLEIYKQGMDSVRYSEIGYSRIRPENSSQKKKLKVLQMNLEPSMSNNTANGTVNFASSTSAEGKKFREYVNQVEDFDVEISFMNNTTWYTKYHNRREQWASDLMDYDMLIVGFKDSANFTNDEDYIYGFEKFRDAGKSIILSHDLVQDATFGIMSKTNNYDTSKIIQSDVKYYLRDISGQIRKYYDAASGSNEYSYSTYYSRGQQYSFLPDDNFRIYTGIVETFCSDLSNFNPFQYPTFAENYEWLDVKNYTETPIYDKYTYTYGVFNDNNYVTHPVQKISLTTPNSVIRDYYSTHDYQPANIIMDNSIRSMLYYNYINYNDNDPNKKYFLDNLDRLVDNIDLTKLAQRRKLTWGSESYLTNTVQSVNEGQITKYPFEIPDSIFVADTHAQNYQLDLEYDKEGDVTVWYNLSGTGNRPTTHRKKVRDTIFGGEYKTVNDSAVNTSSIGVYSGRNQDSRNNYYIYTKGNITYTGLGHSAANNSPMSDDEIKLFINTMIAAYRSSASDPYVTVTNPDAISNGKTTTLYLEDRDTAGSDSAITYRVNDDTTNAKINRTYEVNVYKDGELVDFRRLNKGDMGSVPVSYNEVRTNNEVTYKIVLKSNYKNYAGEYITTEDTRTVNVDLMPMFDLR